MKLACWLLFLVTSASFTTVLVARQYEQRHADRAEQMARPDAWYAAKFDAMVRAEH